MSGETARRLGMSDKRRHWEVPGFGVAIPRSPITFEVTISRGIAILALLPN